VTAATQRVPPLASQPPARLAAAEQHLPSGLRVLAARRGGAPIVEMRLILPCHGGGTAHATAELLAVTILGGTPHRDRQALDADLATMGATLTVAARPEYLLLSGYVLAQHAGRLLALLGEVVTGAAYPDHDVAGQRARLAGRLRAHAAQPHIIARQELLRRCYGDHPAAREVPAERDLVGVSPLALRRLHQATVVPQGAALVLVGEAVPGRLIDAAHAALDGWRGRRPAPAQAPPLPVPPGEVELLDDPAGRQIMVGLASPAPAEADPGYPAAVLANLVLGGYFASRLFEHLREGQGHVYRCTSALDERAGRGAMLLEFATDPDGAGAALRETHEQLCRIARTGPPDAAEIEAARGYAVGSQAVKLATQGGLADALALLALRGQDLSWLPRRARRLATVPGTQVRRWAARLFDPAAMTGFARGPAPLLAGAPSPLGSRIRPPATEQPAPLPRVQPVHSPPVHGGRDD
jgi:predicted Zn-dependent peptidase